MFIITHESDINNIDDKYDVLEIAYTEEGVQEYLKSEGHGENDMEIYVHEFHHSQSFEIEVVTEYNLTSTG